MAELPYYHVDAFASKPLMGNPAAVMPLDAWMSDDMLQAIAAENNFAETAYIVPISDDSWELRWFTPAVEVALCGHATLATAHVLFNHLGAKADTLSFHTRQSGVLTVSRMSDGQLEMDFPASKPRETQIPPGLADILGGTPVDCVAGNMLLVEFETTEQLYALNPDFFALKDLQTDAEMEKGCVIATAKAGADEAANGLDVVSRVFVPGAGIDEDPTTGSAHCLIAPYFHDRQGKTKLSCLQAFPGRGGLIETELRGDRVLLRGKAVTIVEGRFHL